MQKFSTLPNEVISLIFTKLDVPSLVKCSKVCLRWNQIYKSSEKQLLGSICKNNVNINTEQILSKLSTDLEQLTWNQLYMSWQTSFNNDSWEKKCDYIFPLDPGDTDISSIKIYKGYIIIASRESSQSPLISLYSLKTKERLSSYKWNNDYNGFNILEVNDQSFLILSHYDYAPLSIHKFNDGRFNFLNTTEIHGPKFPHLGLSAVFNKYIAFAGADDFTVIKANVDDKTNTMAFELIGNCTVNGIILYMNFWNETLVVYNKTNISLYSIIAHEVSLETKFDIQFSPPFTRHIICFKSFFVCDPKGFYEICKQGNTFELTQHLESMEHFRRSPVTFTNLIFMCSPFENFTKDRILKPSELIEFIKAEQSNKNSDPIFQCDLCFHGDDLVIVWELEDVLLIRTYTIQANNKELQNILPPP